MLIFVFFPNNLNFVADQVQLSTPKEFKTIGIRFRRNRKSHFICLYRVIPKYFKNSYIHPILQNQIDTYFLCFMYKRVFVLLIMVFLSCFENVHSKKIYSSQVSSICSTIFFIHPHNNILSFK
jgi:hypothetical protein